MDIFDKKIILASKSPRRKQLLEESGFSFEVKVHDTDESYAASLSPREVAEYVALQKASAMRHVLHNDEIILAADTIVTADGVIFGKPKDYDDAFRILTLLSGKRHEVITGVCLLSKNKKKVFSSVSGVYFAELSAAEIDFYIKKFHPYDKAGAYGIQEWIGLCKIEKIEGLYSTIVGLPIADIYKALSKWTN